MRHIDRPGPKLELRRQTLRQLTSDDLRAVAGGYQQTSYEPTIYCVQPSHGCNG